MWLGVCGGGGVCGVGVVVVEEWLWWGNSCGRSSEEFVEWVMLWWRIGGCGGKW